MAATVLATLVPHLPYGNRAFYWVPTIAVITAPTSAEINDPTCTDLSGQVTDQAGFSISGTTIDSQSFRGAALKLAGPKTVDDSALTCRNSLTSTDARTIMTQDLAGYIVVFTEGNVTGRKMNVFQVIVNALPLSPGMTDPATTTFQFAITNYAMRVTVP
jgi:hypothetical protein